MSTPAIDLKSSPDRWVELPAPDDANVSDPGFAFASCTSSATLRAGTCGFTTRMFVISDV